MKNNELRAYAKKKGVCFWQIAEVLGISEPTITRRLRKELTEQEKQQYTEIINKLSMSEEEKE